MRLISKFMFHQFTRVYNVQYSLNSALSYLLIIDFGKQVIMLIPLYIFTLFSSTQY